MDYQVQQRDVEFLLDDVFDVQSAWQQIEAFADLTPDVVKAIVAEGGRVAAEVMAPLNQSGDAEGCQWQDGQVTTPNGFASAFSELAHGGWLGLSGNPQFGGQGMPKSLGCLIEEMFWSANSSLYLYGTLTVGACLCIDAHGSHEQKRQYLPKLYSGQWTGAMALTESHAGTDLGIMRTKAEVQSDGSYAITGQKIFITSGEHDMAENIVHLTLARLPDAPLGSKGISLFIVPKFLPNADGSLGQRNGWSSGSLEHKMGIKGSATSVINYDGAKGFLLGEENQGLAAMFTMMNYERLSVGLQGLGAAQLAYQHSASYARERVQGRAPTGPENPEAVADSILVHPDVRRMLLTQRAYAEGCRALGFYVGMQLDLAKYADDAQAQRIGELLTPVVKAFLTDRGLECAVLGQQVLGGHGYVKEWGMEQIVRDARIGQIYEGANGIQAIDLVGRKVVRDGGQTLKELIDEIIATDVDDEFAPALRDVCERLTAVTESVVNRSKQDPNLPGAVSVDFLDFVGLTLCAWMWARMASCAPQDEFGAAKRATARYFYARLLPQTLGLERSIGAEADAVMSLPAAAF
ncbi:MAG: acyl-CoA dehydrogenase C-terminal domain-containing protein [Pseudomonadota bacterium]|nr:acyl-CoA dehydrogenase C-terminal domain-containing protein [Pseudomonadota bacterium]